MWRPAIPAAILLAIVLAIDWPHSTGRAVQPRGRSVQPRHAEPLSAKAARLCGTRVITDWLRDNRIDGNYRRECYEAALAMMPQDGHLPVQDAVEERLRALG